MNNHRPPFTIIQQPSSIISLQEVDARCERFVYNYFNNINNSMQFIIPKCTNFNVTNRQPQQQQQQQQPQMMMTTVHMNVRRVHIPLSVDPEYHRRFLAVFNVLWRRIRTQRQQNHGGGERKYITQREIYYMLTGVFNNQQESNRVLGDVCDTLMLTRRDMGVVASPRGFIYGPLLIHHNHHQQQQQQQQQYQTIDCHVTAQAISYKLIDHTAAYVSTASCIIVIEKEGIFQRLVADGFTKSFPSILITSMGHTTVATRHLVQLLAARLNKPVYGVCDYNPAGYTILNVLQHGSDSGGLEGCLYTCPQLKWIALTHTDIQSMSPPLPRSCFLPLDNNDHALLNGLLASARMRADIAIVRELEGMRDRGVKCELQSLYTLGDRFIGKFLQRKILQTDYHSFIRQHRN